MRFPPLTRLPSYCDGGADATWLSLSEPRSRRGSGRVEAQPTFPAREAEARKPARPAAHQAYQVDLKRPSVAQETAALDASIRQTFSSYDNATSGEPRRIRHLTPFHGDSACRSDRRQQKSGSVPSSISPASLFRHDGID